MIHFLLKAMVILIVTLIVINIFAPNEASIIFDGTSNVFGISKATLQNFFDGIADVVIGAYKLALDYMKK